MKRLLPRQPGGQPGNRNAVTHGFYARRLKKKDLAGFDDAAALSLKDEIALIRVYLRRLVEQSEDQVTTYPQSLARLDSLCSAADILNRLVKTEQSLNTGPGEMENALEEALRQMTEKFKADQEGANEFGSI